MKKETSKCLKYYLEQTAREFPEEFAMISNPTEDDIRFIESVFPDGGPWRK